MLRQQTTSDSWFRENCPRLARAADGWNARLEDERESRRQRGIAARRDLAGKLPSEWPDPQRDLAQRLAQEFAPPATRPVPPPARPCPHCKLVHDGRVITHCLDKRPWTEQEREARRAECHRRLPGVRFVDYRDVAKEN